MNDIYLSVVIPAFNESARIGKTLKLMIGYLEKQNYTYEIVIVDDGSTDNMLEIIEKNKNSKCKIIVHKKNGGKGKAVNTGVKNSIGKYILFADADNSTPFEEVEKLLKFANDADVVIGSRYLKDSNVKVKQPISRIIMARMGNMLIQLLILPGFPDTQCGFKLFTSLAADKIFPRQTIWRWGFDMELLRIAKEQKCKIKQVPVQWINDDDSRVNSKSMFFKTLNELFRIKINSLKGVYRRE
ncbi:MAG: dolichyl-phosphate beta-glucosyltransferase [Patescibacteria group bacterium]|jgi:dolichyl-phosphate beta-glucosyltransferase